MTRSADRILGGVCAGLSEHLGAPVALVRLGMVAFALFGGAGLAFYVWLWATVPAETVADAPLKRVLTKPSADVPQPWPTVPQPWPTVPQPPHLDTGQTAHPPRSAAPAPEPVPAGSHSAFRALGKGFPLTELLLGACLLIIGVALILFQVGVEVPLAVILPTTVVLAGIALAWRQFSGAAQASGGTMPRILGALVLVAAGVLMFFVTAREPNAWTVIAAAVAVLAGVGVALTPWLLRMNRELIAERAGRVREAERAEIAAHLHDSVLQTLALIQQKSEPGSEVSRLARGQERDLRDWLFRGPGDASEEAEDLEAGLREQAATLERDFAVRFEIVSVGAGQVFAPESLLAAAREAMLNAARHAGGEVTVYAEAATDRLSVDVTDRGPGMDLDAVPEGRMGVRESILGRMERAGGTARIVPGPGGSGTSVRLSVPRVIDTPEPPVSAEGAHP